MRPWGRSLAITLDHRWPWLAIGILLLVAGTGIMFLPEAPHSPIECESWVSTLEEPVCSGGEPHWTTTVKDLTSQVLMAGGAALTMLAILPWLFLRLDVLPARCKVCKEPAGPGERHCDKITRLDVKGYDRARFKAHVQSGWQSLWPKSGALYVVALTLILGFGITAASMRGEQVWTCHESQGATGGVLRCGYEYSGPTWAIDSVPWAVGTYFVWMVIFSVDWFRRLGSPIPPEPSMDAPPGGW